MWSLPLAEVRASSFSAKYVSRDLLDRLGEVQPSAEAGSKPDQSSSPKNKGPSGEARGDSTEIYVNIALDLQSLHAGDREALKTRLSSGVSSLFERLAIPPSRGPEDLQLRAIVDKNENEAGELGFRVRYEGAHRDQPVDFQHPPMRCNLCTDGEFVERFVEDLEALLQEWKSRQTTKVAAELEAVSPGELAQESRSPAALDNSRIESQPRRVRSRRGEMERPPVDSERSLQFRPSGRGRLELQGWLGIGLTVGGLAGLGASLLTMPRNQVNPENPAKRDRYTPTTATYIGSTLGAAAVIGGIILLIRDLRD